MADRAVQFPTRAHQDALQAVLSALQADASVAGVLLAGSLARGAARADSDIDVLIALTDGTIGDDARHFSRTYHGVVEVEQSARTEAGWLAQFAPSRVGDESWGYAFLDGLILHDPHRVVTRLVAAAADVHACYRVPAHIIAHYGQLWNHLRPKMEAVLRGGDVAEIGWASAVMTEHIIRTLWAINHGPPPSMDLGRFQRHLDDLTLPPGTPALVREMLAAAPADALRRQLELLDLASPYLTRR